MEIDGRVALVTGAAAGTGQAIACRLAGHGARLVLADVADCTQTLRMVEDVGGDTAVVTADLCDDAEVRRLVDVAVERFGGIEILVNNAGGGQPAARYPDATAERWSGVLDLNLRVPMLVTQVALPALSAGGGVVVNVASTAGLDHTPYGWPEYAAAKAGLIRFTTAMADLSGRSGVRVTCVVPDWVRTPRAEAELERMTAAERAAHPNPIPLPVLTDAVLDLVRDDNLHGHVVVLRPDEEPRPLQRLGAEPVERNRPMSAE
jgi:NAD(P)-dependent dehydrogenase (short-subunit alcohol dehydrogenase family)